VRGFAHWSIRYKLLLVLVSLGITTFVATGAIAYIRYLRSVKEGVVQQLTGVTRVKAREIETYYRGIQNHLLTLSQDRMLVDAITEFLAAYRALDEGPIAPEDLDTLRQDYRERFYPELQKVNLARPRYEDYMPFSPAAIHLQSAYIAKHKVSAQGRREINNAGDGSDYSAVHEKYHPRLRKIVEKFGYYDLYLIDYQTRRVIYDVNKDRAFGTGLLDGPYREGNLAKVVKQCVDANNPDAAFISDFEPNQASAGVPTQFAASPVSDGPGRTGVIALQLSTEALNDIMTGGRDWKREGLGRTGQAVVIGPDYLLRSNNRRFLESPNAFLASLKATGIPEDQINRIRRLNSTVLELAVKLPSVTDALAGKEGMTTESWPFADGLESVAFQPLHIPGLKWIVESRMNQNEVLESVRQLQGLFGRWGGGLLLLTIVAAFFLTALIVRPVKALIRAAVRVAAGDFTATVHWKWKDELGILADAFNAMTYSIREKTEIIEQKNRENEALLLNILPAEIASRLKGGEASIADGFADVTVLFGDLVGFTVLSGEIPAGELVDLLNGLFVRFDEAAGEFGIEKIKTIGDCYMAVCGLPVRYPDHAERMARMALGMTEATRRYSEEMGRNLQIRIGLHSGPVVAGVIGARKFIYDLWGDTVNIASRMESTGVPGQIQVTRSVYERLQGQFELESRGVIKVKGKGEIETWLLVREARVVGAPA
jgi:class 3 adenylate cyclase/HAMP domain-containing protein